MQIRSTLTLLALLIAAPAFAQDWPAVAAAMSDLERDGYFTRCSQGDGRACSLYTRLVGVTVNPTGAPSGWGWLGKAGGKNFDGYAEDALAWTADPANQRNVIDIICGADAVGARPCAPRDASSFVPRRAGDPWVRPVPLSAADLAYLRPGAPMPPTPTPTPTPQPPAPTVDLAPVIAKLDALSSQVAALQAAQGEQGMSVALALEAAQRAAHNAEQGALAVLDVKNWLDAGLMVELRVPTFGGTARGAATVRRAP